MKEKKHNDLTGQVFGRLTVIGFSHVGDDGRLRYWDCQCECGNRKAIPEISLLSGSANSCGCLRKEIAAELMTTHGESRSPLYRVWARLKSVCYNESYKEYPSYGAKGIKVCEAWMGYEGFRAWAYENGYSPDKKLRLMRIDTDGDFTPGNCKWQASSPQTDKVEDIPRKKRSTRSDLKEQGGDDHQGDIVAPPRNDLTGQTFGRVTVLGFSHKKGKMRYWLCRCECGTERPFPERGLVEGKTKSCGCIRKELPLMKASKHGGTGSLLYNVWHALKDVCLNENSGAYHRYGARGITICDEWRYDFAVFRDWAYEHGYSVYPPVVLRRLDTSGDFEPDNCMWLRVKKSKKIAYRGVEHTVAEWARIFGVDKGTLRHRLRNCDHDLAAACKDPIGRDKKQIDLDALIPAPKSGARKPKKRWGDLTGQVFGRFTVLGFSHKKGTVKYWRCRCECGNERTVAAQSLLSGASKSCGCLRSLRRKDLTGQVFGKLTVLGYAGSNGFVSLWRCRCECGNEIVLPRGSLTTGATRSCGCLKRGPKMKGKGKMDIIGKRFGRLTVIAFDGIRGRRASYWLCRCDCGNEKVITRSSLISGNTRSCGCLKKEVNPTMTHGGSNTNLYRRWNRVRHDPKSTMCDEWMEFPAFKDWALANGYEEDKELYLHRKVPREGYTPENCTWIPRGEHFKGGHNNATRKKLAYGGLMMKTTEWAKLLGVRKEVLYQRLYRYDKDLARVCKIPFDGKQVDLDTIVEAEKKRLAGNVLSFR